MIPSSVCTNEVIHGCPLASFKKEAAHKAVMWWESWDFEWVQPPVRGGGLEINFNDVAKDRI